MATWTPRDSDDLGADQIATTITADALYNNPIAIAEGAEGAPRVVYGALDLSNDITQGDISSNSIGQGELRTSTASTEVDVDSGTGQNITLVGGGYSHFALSDANNNRLLLSSSTSSSNFTIGVWRTDEGGSGDTGATLHERYHSASRPYDLGDGECGLFVYTLIRGDPTKFSVSVSPDPVWAYNGPTDIRPDWFDKKTGKKYKRLRRPALCRADLESGKCDMADYLAAQKEAPIEDVEITPEYKNADMALIPHSWSSAPQGTICLLDPVNTHDLLALHEAGEDIADLIHKGYIKIGDECNRCGPPGVKVISWKFK